MESQPATTGRQWLRTASLAQLQSIGQASSQNPAAAAPAPAPVPAAPAPTAGPPRPTQVAGPRIPLSRPQAELGQAQPPVPQSQPELIQALTRPPTPAMTQSQPSSTTNGTPLAQATPPPAADSSQTPIPKIPQSPRPPSPRYRVATPPESPRVIKPTSLTPPEPPKITQLQPIKAPPPPHPEPEPKSMFMQQENSNGSVKTIADIKGKPAVNGNQSHTDARGPPPSSKRETAANGTGMATAWKKKDDGGEMKVITMAGENTGAYMELGSPHACHINRKQQHGYQLLRQAKGSELQNEDGKSEDKKKNKGQKLGSEGKPIAALVNSNVQSVNNAILLRSSCTQQNPGIHFTLVSQRHPKHKGSTQ